MQDDVKEYWIGARWPKKPSTSVRLRIFVFCLAVTLALFIVFIFAIKPAFASAQTWRDFFVLSLVLPVWFTFGLPIILSGESRLIVGDDFVEQITPMSLITARKRILRSRVKSVSEVSINFFGLHSTGVAVRDRGKFGSRMLGSVFIPCTMEGYEVVKAKLLTWAPGEQCGS